MRCSYFQTNRQRNHSYDTNKMEVLLQEKHSYDTSLIEEMQIFLSQPKEKHSCDMSGLTQVYKLLTPR